MAGFTGIRGDGLVRAQRALARLEGDPQQLHRARIRFDDSLPPPYTSDRSGTTTRSQSPNPPSEEQRRRQERRIQLVREREASEPHEQFSAQVEEERRRMWNTDASTSWRELTVADLYTFKQEASEIVRKRWAEQGIWNDSWNQFAFGRWKHEEPLQLEAEPKTDSETGPSHSPFSFFPGPQPKPRRPRSNAEKQRIAEQQTIREREREASRPYHQFVYQISKERERIQDEPANRRSEGAGAAVVNTTAYENVKSTWTKRGIWNKRWGILPGMLWKHEEPLEEKAADCPSPAPTNRLVDGSHEAGEARAIRVSGSPSPVESNHYQVSGAMNSSQQGSSVNMDSAELEISNAERSTSAPNSPRARTGKRVLRPTTRQASKRNFPHKNGQLASASLGPVHSSKVSKAAVKKKPGPRGRLNVSHKISSDSLPFSDVDAAEPQPSPPPDHVTPRRSKRIQPPVPTWTTSAEPSKRAVQSTPEGNVASFLTARSSAKAQGISKKRPLNVTQGRARKK